MSPGVLPLNESLYKDREIVIVINKENVCLISATVHNLRFLIEAPLIQLSFIDPAKPYMPRNDFNLIYGRII